MGVGVYFLLLLLSSVHEGGLVNHKADVGSCGRERVFALLEVRRCERTERKPVLVEYRGHTS